MSADQSGCRPAQHLRATAAAVPFSYVKEQEFEEISSRRRCFGFHLPDCTQVSDCKDALGLAISGGGIRSATFSLGILQALARRGILRHLDYLSTVSGGGYIGSWWASWIRREQLNSAPHEKFQSVVSELGGKGDEEAPEITFLRMYSNYLTPRVSFFSADTWVVSAIWARNTLLNLAILVALFASIVLMVRGAGLAGFHFVWPDPNDELLWAPLCALPLAPMVILVGWNLWRNSTIALLSKPPDKRTGESSDTLVICFCLFLLLAGIAYSFWLASAQSLFVDADLWSGVRANFFVLWPAYFVLQVCTRLYKCHLAKQKELHGRPSLRWGDYIGALTPYVFGPAGAAFVTAALLRLLAFLFNGMQASDPARPWFVLAWGPPLVLLAFTVGMIVHIGLMGRDLPEASREWLGRLRGWLVIYTVLWIIVIGISIYGPYVIALIGAKTPTVIASLGVGWVASTAAGLFAGQSDKTSGKTDTSGKRSVSVLEIVALVGPYIFMFGFMFLVAFGTHTVLVQNLNAAPRPPQQSKIEKYDLKVADGNIQLSREKQNISDTGFEWLLNRYWAQMACTEFWVSGTKDRWFFSGVAPLFGLLLVAGGLLAWRVDINVFSMHNFYKNRLVRCYLGASRRLHRKPSPFTGFDDFDDALLHKFRTSEGYYGPYPILNAALNVTSGGKLQYQDRQAESFIFTPWYTGFSAENVVNEERLGDETEKTLSSYQKPAERSAEIAGIAGLTRALAYRPTKVAGGGVSVGMAMAISGAAVNPNMGYHTSTVVSFLLTVFNVRLGWWLGNALKKSFRNPGPPFGLWYSLQELFGMANADSNYVNLSDGGHFDNMGIYELVRRRCQYIICCDGEQDEDLTFGGIGNVIRKCRTDFKVDIDLPVAPLQKVNGLSSAHCVVGKIKYPDGPNGYLLYLKATLTGDETTDIQEYHSRQPAFPHQSTGDQWFDESQFESYRKLGQHIAEKALSTLQLDTTPEERSKDAEADKHRREKFFSALWQIWYPASVAVEKNSAAHSDMYNRILEAIRKEDKIENLDAALFEDYSDKTKWDHRTGHLCNSLIQLMQRVFYDLNLEDRANWEHPFIKGWIDIFGHWVHSGPFKEAWAVTKDSYPERFCRFYRSLPEPKHDASECGSDLDDEPSASPGE